MLKPPPNFPSKGAVPEPAELLPLLLGVSCPQQDGILAAKHSSHRSCLWRRRPQNGTHHRNEIWILAKLLNESIVTGISTLGYNDSSEKEWVTDYMLMYSTGKEYLSFKETSGEVKVRRYLVIAVYLAPFLFLFVFL